MYKHNGAKQEKLHNINHVAGFRQWSKQKKQNSNQNVYVEIGKEIVFGEK